MIVSTDRKRREAPESGLTEGAVFNPSSSSRKRSPSVCKRKKKFPELCRSQKRRSFHGVRREICATRFDRSDPFRFSTTMTVWTLSLIVTCVVIASASRRPQRVPLHHDGARPQLSSPDGQQPAVSPVLDQASPPPPPHIVPNQVQDRNLYEDDSTIESVANRRASFAADNPTPESDAV